MSKAINKTQQRFTNLYITALSAVALLSIAGQVLVQVTLKEQSTDAGVINLAGRQRMLSQRICKNCILITHQINYKQNHNQRKELSESIITWKKVHLGLQSNYLDSVGPKSTNSKEIQSLFKIVEPHFQTILNNANYIAKESNDSFYTTYLDSILSHEKEFLKGMNSIVFQYDKEARSRVQTLKNIELILLCFTLFILLFEGLFIFSPAVKKLGLTIKQLIDSEVNTKKINQQLLIANTNLKKAELELIQATNEKQEAQKIRATSLLKGQENERKRLAREMHDGIGQMLTALKLNIESISTNQLDEKNRLILEEARSLVSKTINETRSITFDLMPTVLNDFGIVSALKQLAEQASKNSGAQVSFANSNTFERLDKHIEINLYRITQEAINNAVKYANAKDITISLSLKNNFLYLNISDNGQGFDFDKVYLDATQKKINRGIHNMQERTNLMNGKFKLSTSLGKGTKISSIIPVKFQQ